MKSNHFKQFFKNIPTHIAHGISIVTNRWCRTANFIGNIVTIALILPVAIPMNIIQGFQSLINTIRGKFNKTTGTAEAAV